MPFDLWYFKTDVPNFAPFLPKNYTLISISNLHNGITKESLDKIMSLKIIGKLVHFETQQICQSSCRLETYHFEAF